MKIKTCACWTLIAGLLLSSFVFAAELDTAVQDTAVYLLETVKNPGVGAVGGEWAVLGLARSGYAVPESFYSSYYHNAEAYILENEGDLQAQKYTEYARMALALSAIGADPRSIGGANLLLPLADYKKTVWQGVNGAILALLALDGREYDIPQNPEAEIQATRELYLEKILESQLPSGGFSLTKDADPDLTGMALQALAKYQHREAVREAAGRALTCLSELQNQDGGYESWGTANLESTAQVAMALCEWGIALEDQRFVKNGKTLLDNILAFYRSGQGFLHSQSAVGDNQMATEQAFCALVNLRRVQTGKSSLYRMTDVTKKTYTAEEGLPGKNLAVKKMPLACQGKSFQDVGEHENRAAIEALAERAIINGKSEDLFAPDQTMNRAEFAAIITRGLGLTVQASVQFEDVAADAWYAGAVGTAIQYGIVKGLSDTVFAPEAVITKEEAAVMVARSAVICGADTKMAEAEIRDTLAQFLDYTECAEWAKSALAYCYRENILPQSDMEILPQHYVKRCEIAQMLYELLKVTRLL